VVDNPHCWLLVDGVNKPRLFYYRPVDFWHKVPDLPNAFWCEQMEIHYLTRPEQIADFLPTVRDEWAYVGGHLEVSQLLGFGHFNPEAVLNALHYQRAWKTGYELECLREANRIGARGHLAAREAFLAGASEFEINLAYMNAVGQGANDAPYSNIVAINEHAAVLHYTHLSHQRIADIERHSFLIDAGVDVHGYASDITRTWAWRRGLFADLVSALEVQQQAIIGEMRSGMRYTDLHLRMHQRLASVLVDAELVDMSPDDMVSSGVTAVFFPHGLGHLLGLQVHDVGGFMQDDRGTHLAPPEAHPFLRCTRVMEPEQVFTIEPGLYFIDSLLSTLQEGEHARRINWELVDALRPCGGIRIEDNVVLHADGVENLTRQAGL
jgi:Xaa-Pro dipeptidase